jgi:ABC-type multidrug transport system fused ATPase/permease subunit
LIVTHRLSTIENADVIWVLNQGQLEAIGTHSELMNKSPTYRKMAEIQGYHL